MEKTKKLIILGASSVAEVLFEYFQFDSPFDVVGFSVDRDFLKKDSFLNLPLVPFEDVQNHFAPGEHFFFAAINYQDMNNIRKRFYLNAKFKGYQPASYISPQAFVWKNAKIGEHCFIFEHNTIQPFVTIGNNVIMWSGNHIGHHSIIHNHTFVSSQVVISGSCEVGEGCFLGVNSTIINNVSIGRNTVVAAAATIYTNVPENQKVMGIWAKK